MANGLQWPLWRERSPLTGLLVHFELLASSNANTDQNRERRTMELEKPQCFSCTRISFDSWSFWEHSGGYELVGYGCSLLAYTRGLNVEGDCQSLISIYGCIMCTVQGKAAAYKSNPQMFLQTSKKIWNASVRPTHLWRRPVWKHKYSLQLKLHV